jgi:hypothetical protein
MKIKQQSNKSKKIILIVLIVLFLGAAGYAGAAAKLHLWPFQEKSQTASTPTQEEIDSNNKDSPKKDKGDTATTPDKTPAVEPNKTTDQVPTNTELTAQITELRQADGNIFFTGVAKGGSGQAGSCVVTFSSPNDKPVTRQVDSGTKDGVITCGQVQISQLEFSYLGTWNVNFRFYTNNQQANASATIDIR